MTDAAKTGFVGLVTNVSPEVSPVGALDVAENVVIRSPGQIEPRPGIVSVELGWTPATSTPKKIWEYDGKAYVLATDGVFRYDSSTERRLVKTDGTTIDPILFRGDLLTVAQARDNCYVATQTGVLKFTDSSDTAFTECGSPPVFVIGALQLSSLGTPRALATGYKFGYRVVAKKTDANGLITRSSPTGTHVISNTSDATRDVGLYVRISAEVYGTLAGSSGTVAFEVYRTKATLNANTLDEEYSLVKTVAAATFFYDTALDTERGARLYTSPSQGGALAENQRPPACGCVESYRGHMFYGNTVGPFNKLLSATVDTGFVLTSATSAGLGERTDATATCASGAATITGLASTTGLRAGMIVAFADGAAGWCHPQGTYIVSVDSATQVTVSANATASRGPATARFIDAIYIGGAWKPIFSYAVTAVGGYNYDTAQAWFEHGIAGIAPISSTAAAVGSSTYFARSVTPASPGYNTTVILSEITRSASSSTSTIKATHGDEYSPALDTYSGSGTSMDRDVFMNGLAWSKLDEPEHVPPINFARVGDKGKAVLGLAATRDSLFVIKEDGIWRLTGPGGNAVNTWRIDPFDLTTFCVLPQSIAKLNNRVYFLSQKGIVRLSDSGVEIVSNPINDQVKRFAFRAYDYKTTNGYYSLGDSPYWGAAANEIDSEYVLAIGDVAGEKFDGMLVYNETTNAWTTWAMAANSTAYAASSKSPSAIGWSPYFQGLLFGTANTAGWLKRTGTPVEPSVAVVNDQRDDGTYLNSANTVTGASAPWSVAYNTAYQLAAGDVIVSVATGIAYIVETAPTSTSVTVSDVSGGQTAPDEGDFTSIGTIRCTVRARPFTQPSTRQKLWTAVSAGLSLVDGAISVKVTTLANNNTNTADTAAILSEKPAGLGYSNGLIRALRGNLYTNSVPRAFARSWRLSPGVEIIMCAGNFKLDLLASGMRDTETGKTANTSTT